MRVICLSYHLTFFLGTDFKQPAHLFMAECDFSEALWGRQRNHPLIWSSRLCFFCLSPLHCLVRDKVRPCSGTMQITAHWPPVVHLYPREGLKGSAACSPVSFLISTNVYMTDFLRGHKDLCYDRLVEWVGTPYQPRDVLEPRPMSRKRVSTWPWACLWGNH